MGQSHLRCLHFAWVRRTGKESPGVGPACPFTVGVLTASPQLLRMWLRVEVGL